MQHFCFLQVDDPEALGGVGQVHVGHGQQAGALDAAGGVQREVAHAGLLQHGGTQVGGGRAQGSVQPANGLAQRVGHIGQYRHRREGQRIGNGGASNAPRREPCRSGARLPGTGRDAATRFIGPDLTAAQLRHCGQP